MFGHQDDKKDDQKQDETAVETATADAPETTDQAENTPPTDQGQVNADDSQAPGSDGDDNAWQHPGAPLENVEEEKNEEEDDDKEPNPISDIIAPSGSTGAPHIDRPIVGGPSSDFSFSTPADDDDSIPHELIDIKQKALHELTPLVDKLDQTPEDRFRTLMMMIQAGDDQKLIKEAYEAAEKIQDEKMRGQALLDIVNEINYFTQHPVSE